MTAIASMSAGTIADAEREGVLAAMEGRIEPVKVAPTYQLGLLAVAIVMVLLPLVYVALICLVAWGTFWYALNAVTIFDTMGAGRQWFWALLAYVSPLIVGGVLVAFMIKPLFAKKTQQPANFTLSRSEQRALYTFVGKLCRVVGSPEPCRIDVDLQVNASASFREGLIGFLKGELVLTIGLPLAAGMSTRELAGVLAHEFGHFAQGTGMRLTYIVRRVNAWFARVVYERDSWDDWLQQAAQSDAHVAINLVAWLAKGAVWLTRRVLWLLMWTGHLVSSFMLRQMEFDADRYEARVAGRESFESTFERLSMLSVASNAAFSDLNEAWREKRLCDDLSKLIISREVNMPTEVRKLVREHTAKQKTGWFDSHPSEGDRIASVKRENAPGFFHVAGPAQMLFDDFDGLCRRATESFYRLNLGEHFSPQQVVATDRIVAETGEQQKSADALGNFFQRLVHPIRPVFPGRDRDMPTGPQGAADMLLLARNNLMESAEAGGKAAAEFQAADERLINGVRMLALTSVGATYQAGMPDAGVKGAPTDANVRAAIAEQETIRTRALEVINPLLNEAMIRIEIALEFARRERAANTPAAPSEEGEYGLSESAQEEDAVSVALSVIKAAAGRTENLRRDYVALEGLLSLVKPQSNPQILITLILEKAKKMHADLGELHALLRRAKYPYEHTEAGATLSRFAVPEMPKVDEVGAILQAAGATLNAVYSLYMRMMGDLARQAEAFEKSLGLEPLPGPKPEPAKT